MSLCILTWFRYLLRVVLFFMYTYCFRRVVDYSIMIMVSGVGFGSQNDYGPRLVIICGIMNAAFTGSE